MKKIYFILLVIVFTCLFNNVVYASSSFSTSVAQVISGETFTASVNINPAASWNIHMTSTGPVSGCTINQADATADAMNASKSFSVTCTSTGVGTITLTLSGDYTSADGANYSLSGTKTVMVVNAPATTQAPVITQAPVTTQAPTTKPVSQPVNTITTTKKVGNSDASLKLLSIEGQSLEFNSTVYEYNLIVSAKVETVKVVAEANDPKAIVTGLGEIALQTGENKIGVVVIAENGNKKIYTIKIIKSEQENIPSTNLSKLMINDKNIDLLGHYFLVGINDVNSFNMIYETSSSTTKYEIEGDKDLKEGINKVTLTLLDADCEKNSYVIYVYVKPSEYELLLNINDNIDINNNLMFYNNQYKKQMITDSFLKQFKESKKEFVYNVVNENEGLLNSFKFKNNNIGDNAFELKFIRIGSDPLTYISNLKKGVEIKTYIEERYKDGTFLKLYSYDQKNNIYKLIDSNIKVKNGYISFVSDGSEQYIFSKEELIVKTPIREWIIRISICIISFGLSFILFKLTVKNKNVNNKKKIDDIENKKDDNIVNKKNDNKKDLNKVDIKEKQNNFDNKEPEKNINRVYKKNDFIKEKRKNNTSFYKAPNYKNEINNFKKNSISKRNENWYR